MTREDEWRRMTSTGITLAGTSDIGITGNTFAGLHTKALTLEGEPSRRVLFSGNLLVDTDGGQAGWSNRWWLTISPAARRRSDCRKIFRD